MNNLTEAKSRQLLREIEAQHGRLRLDQGDFHADYEYPAWDESVLGERPPIPEDTEPIVKMFDTNNLQGLRKAASVLAPEHINIISGMTMGWTSIPVVNACAVRRADAMGIALNLRLNNVLIPANVLYWQMLEGILEPNADKARVAAVRIRQLLTGANHGQYDEVMAEVRPFADWEDYRWGVKLTQLQMLFVLLHEYGHMVLGHLLQSDFWVGHPLTSNNFYFFTGSQQTELDADRFALDHLLDYMKWDQVIYKIPDGGFDLLTEHDITRWLIPSQLLFLFACFHMLAPIDQESYYKVPQSHPHPFDRMQQIVDSLSDKTFFDMDRAKTVTGILQGTFS